MGFNSALKGLIGMAPIKTTSSCNSKLYVNQRVEELYNKSNTVKVIKSSRLRWAGHVVRMDEKELPKR